MHLLPWRTRVIPGADPAAAVASFHPLVHDIARDDPRLPHLVQPVPTNPGARSPLDPRPREDIQLHAESWGQSGFGGHQEFTQLDGHNMTGALAGGQLSPWQCPIGQFTLVIGTIITAQSPYKTSAQCSCARPRRLLCNYTAPVLTKRPKALEMAENLAPADTPRRKGRFEVKR